MISHDKQYEGLTSLINSHVERSIDAFKLFLQMFSALIGGSIWLSLQRGASQALRDRCVLLSDAAVLLLTFVVIVMVCDNLRAWRGYRIALSELGGKDHSGAHRIQLPKIFRSALTEGAILLAIVLACALFCLENPFGTWNK